MIPISKPFIGEEEKRAVLEVLESGMLVQGPKAAKLEENFTAICSTQYAIATTSGTTALHVALLAHGIGPGDEVITTPFTFMASVNAILYVGARPVFVDIEEDSFNINPALMEAAITPKTKAILPVHLYGYPCNMDAIMEIARKYNLVVIEDACQAVGARFQGRPVGSFGTGCFSLYATKNIMAGEGGMITTNDPDFAQRCRMIRNHGMQRRYYHDMLGYNFRISDLHAAIGLAQTERLEHFTEVRKANAAFFKFPYHPRENTRRSTRLRTCLASIYHSHGACERPRRCRKKAQRGRYWHGSFLPNPGLSAGSPGCDGLRVSLFTSDRVHG